LKRAEINEIIKQELEYIPKGSKGSIQNRLRFHYSAFRRKGISKGKSRQECLKETIDLLKTNNPGFQPEFDKSFFDIKTQQAPRPGFLRRLLRIGN
jgi:hypothetical protein